MRLLIPYFSDNKTPTARRFTIISLCSLVLFALVSYWSVVTQSEMGILYHFSFGNMAIIAVSALFIITVSQFFLLRDLASWYYSLYLVLSICYFHYSVFTAEHKLTDLPPFVHNSVGIMLIGGYFLYVRFTIYFLNIEKEHPNFARRLHLYAFFYLVLLVIDLSLPLFFREKRALLVASMITVFACIPIGIICISECFLILRGRLARIFLAGSMCYFIGSVLGYVFSSGLMSNPFTNPVMKNWTFFTEFGTLLEVIFFSTGLSYRMRLIDIEKKELEKTLLINQLKELETANALLKQRERISHDLHDDVGTTLNSIAVFTEIALQQVRTINPQSIPVLERIGDASRHLIDTLNDIVWAENPKNDHFENITLRMRLFAAELLMPRHVTLNFNADNRLNSLNLPVEQRKQFYLIFKEAVNNIYKYAECTTVNISIELRDKDICMHIIDNGKGFDANNPKNGNGLKSMHNRANILRGSFSIRSELGKGTTLSLCFPINDVEDIKNVKDIKVDKQERPKRVVKKAVNSYNFVGIKLF